MSKLHVKRKPTYLIRCADGCKMPLHNSVLVVDGGIRPQVFTPETQVHVYHSPFVVRRIAAGDFVEVVQAKPAKKKER